MKTAIFSGCLKMNDLRKLDSPYGAFPSPSSPPFEGIRAH